MSAFDPGTWAKRLEPQSSRDRSSEHKPSPEARAPRREIFKYKASIHRTLNVHCYIRHLSSINSRCTPRNGCKTHIRCNANLLLKAIVELGSSISPRAKISSPVSVKLLASSRGLCSVSSQGSLSTRSGCRTQTSHYRIFLRLAQTQALPKPCPQILASTSLEASTHLLASASLHMTILLRASSQMRKRTSKLAILYTLS